MRTKAYTHSFHTRLRSRSPPKRLPDAQYDLFGTLESRGHGRWRAGSPTESYPELAKSWPARKLFERPTQLSEPQPMNLSEAGLIAAPKFAKSYEKTARKAFLRSS